MQNNIAVVVTGGNSGIGCSVTEVMLEKGWWVFSAVTSPGGVNSSSHERLTSLYLDLTKENTIEDFVKNVVVSLKENKLELKGLVNAAASEHHGPLEILPMEWIRYEMEVGFFGSLMLTRKLIPFLRLNKGRIVNFSSVHGRSAARSIGASCATKYAIEAVSDVLRMELSQWGVEVCLIEPGAVNTPLWNKALCKFNALREMVDLDKLKLYYPSFENAQKQAVRDKEFFTRWALSPSVVANDVYHALTVRHPQARYIIGWDARILVFLKYVLPDRLFDRLSMYIFKEQ